MWTLLVIATLVLNSVSCMRHHVTGRSPLGQKIGFDLQMDTDVLEVVSQTPDTAPDNFRQTTSRYFFSKELVAHKDQTADRCYLQRSTLTRDDIERRMNNINESTTSDMNGVQEEWIDPGRALLISHQVVTSVFGSEVAEFCRFEEVYYLGEGSYGEASLSASIVGAGPLSPLGRHKRSTQPVRRVVIVIIIIIVVEE